MSRRHRVERINYFGPESRHLYWREAKEVLTACLRDHGFSPPFREFCRRWFRKGAPIDPAVIGTPEPSLQILLRQFATACPGLPADVREDARLWLSLPDARIWRHPATRELMLPSADLRRTIVKKMRVYEEAFVPFNLCLYAPQDTPYHEYNRIGLTLETTS